MRYTDCIKKIIKEYVDNNELPGAVFAFVSDEGFEQDCYGYSSLKPERKETSLKTMYDMASLSKVITTGVMTLKLIEDGIVHFEDKVSDILPEYPYKDVTILNLLVHTSGMYADDKDYKKCKNKDELWDFICHLPLHNKTNETVEYSCFGYITLGKVIEHFKGDFEAFAKEIVFDKLESNNIMYNPYLKGRADDCASTEITEARGIIKGIVHDGKCNIMGGVAGNAGVFSDIETACRFVKMILDGGIYNGNRILKEETVNLYKKCFTEGMNERRTVGSWYMGDHTTTAGSHISELSLFHTGFTGTSIYVDFERRCGVIILANPVHISRNHKMKEIRIRVHDAVLEEFDRK